jgi:multidrug efflux system membrane fusion protein
MRASRIVAVGLVLAAGLWIGSGHFMPHESGKSAAAIRPTDAAPKRFRVAVQTVQSVPHSRTLVLSGRTEADRKVLAVARTNGIVTDLKVRRGSIVKEGDVLAVLSDEAREAEVAKAVALLTQRKTELEARSKLVAQGTLPRLELGNLEAQYKAAEAGLAAAQAELARGKVLAPWSGIVTEVPAEVGQGLSPGKEVAHIIALDPMLAVVEVAERQLGGLKIGNDAEVRLVTGDTRTGRVRFVANTASPTTRTYRVEVELANADRSIPDGITAEVAIPMAAAPASRVPRSALTFSTAGDIGVRLVDAAGKVGFAAVKVLDDAQQFMWVSGLPDESRVIVQGQDFVREGQVVEAVNAVDVQTAVR